MTKKNAHPLMGEYCVVEYDFNVWPVVVITGIPSYNGMAC